MISIPLKLLPRRRGNASGFFEHSQRHAKQALLIPISVFGFRWEDVMSPHVSKITGASTTSPKGPKRRKSRAPRRPPAAEASQHDTVQDIVPETAVTVAAAPARDRGLLTYRCSPP
jgi:hypothetical protein